MNGSSLKSGLRALRSASFGALKTCGISAAVAASKWRRDRLLILCYHGISIADEDRWLPRTYMPQAALRARFQLIKDFGCSVLALSEAVERLYSGSLPPQAVAITFDDGGLDFYLRAMPVIREFGFSATVYQTTYYSDFPRPIFNLACSYMLWKSRDRALAPDPALGISEACVLETEQSRQSALKHILLFAEKEKLSGAAKDQLARRLAVALGFDYDAFCASRLLQQMVPAEIAELSAAGIDFQLHTHRHRTPDDEQLFRAEIRDNRRRLREITGRDAAHFCYPSGVYQLKNLPWLAAEEVRSATTCEPYLASRTSQPLLLPRFVDTTAKSQLEFESWLSGLGSLMARRPAAASANVSGYR
jgi:peptidoglycan/xylan/chitin deacetylase (PgdA/CDA1 family)